MVIGEAGGGHVHRVQDRGRDARLHDMRGGRGADDGLIEENALQIDHQRRATGDGQHLIYQSVTDGGGGQVRLKIPARKEIARQIENLLIVISKACAGCRVAMPDGGDIAGRVAWISAIFSLITVADDDRRRAQAGLQQHVHGQRGLAIEVAGLVQLTHFID